MVRKRTCELNYIQTTNIVGVTFINSWSYLTVLAWYEELQAKLQFL